MDKFQCFLTRCGDEIVRAVDADETSLCGERSWHFVGIAYTEEEVVTLFEELRE